MWKNIWSAGLGPTRSAGSMKYDNAESGLRIADEHTMLKRVAVYASFVRFSHSVFALPFALAGALLAAQRLQPADPVGWLAGEGVRRLVWILVAMVAARSAAMGFNRLADARVDALNPRTANRELPRGAMSLREAALF